MGSGHQVLRPSTTFDYLISNITLCHNSGTPSLGTVSISHVIATPSCLYPTIKFIKLIDRKHRLFC